MTCWYEGRGGGVVQDTPEVRQILEEFLEEFSLEADDPVDIMDGPTPGTLVIEVNWHGFSSNSFASDIDGKLMELKNFVVGDLALAFDYQYENEREQMYIGTLEQIANAQSARALQEVEQLQGKLKPEDKIKAIETLSG